MNWLFFAFVIAMTVIIVYGTLFYNNSFTSIQVTGANSVEEEGQLKQQLLSLVGTRLTSVKEIVVSESGEAVNTEGKSVLVEIETPEGKKITYLGDPNEPSPIVPRIVQVLSCSTDASCYTETLPTGEVVRYLCNPAGCFCMNPAGDQNC